MANMLLRFRFSKTLAMKPGQIRDKMHLLSPVLAQPMPGMYASGTLTAGMQPRLIDDAKALTPDQRRAFLAAFFGWMLDGFDYTVLTFVLVDIQRSFTIDNTLAGALGTVTLMFRLVGGAAAGTMADRVGRKLPLILSIVWFSIFTVLSGF